MKKKPSDLNIHSAILRYASCLFALLAITLWGDVPASAQHGESPGVRGFLDEDGDGFNDLLPDFDGDGVPDPLDPDFHGRNSDSAFMHQEMNGPGMHDEQMRNMMGGHMEMHGEPGQFGPGDSTGHGGMHEGGMGGHHGGMDSTGGGMGGGGGMGNGKIDPTAPRQEIIRDRGQDKGIEAPFSEPRDRETKTDVDRQARETGGKK